MANEFHQRPSGQSVRPKKHSGQGAVNLAVIISGALVKFDPFASARERAFALAASGDYLLWPTIAQVLASEGFSIAIIKQIGKDIAAQREISLRIRAAEEARPASPAETRQTRWRNNG